MTPAPSLADTSLVEQIAAAAAASLPIGVTVTPSSPLPIGSAPLPPAAGAVRIRFAGGRAGSIAVLVAGDVVASLEESSIGELDLADALRPTLAAAAAAAGPGGVEDPERMDATALLSEMGLLPDAVAVPLLAAGEVHAVVLVALTPESTTAGTPGRGPVLSPDGLHMLHDVEMAVTVEIGRTRLAVRDLLSLAPGAVVELDRAAGSPADLLVNGRMIARGEIVVVDEDYALRITEIVNGSDLPS